MWLWWFKTSFLAQDKGFPFFETFVKNNININQSFVAIINQIIKLRIGKKKEQGRADFTMAMCSDMWWYVVTYWEKNK